MLVIIPVTIDKTGTKADCQFSTDQSLAAQIESVSVNYGIDRVGVLRDIFNHASACSSASSAIIQFLGDWSYSTDSSVEGRVL